MSRYFDTPEYEELKFERDALFHAPGRLDYNRPAIALLEQRIADGRWHFDNPGKTGSWRIGDKNGVIESAGVPRFETEAAALSYITTLSNFVRPLAMAIYRPSRQTLDAMAAPYGRAA